MSGTFGSILWDMFEESIMLNLCKKEGTGIEEEKSK
jgi:hypothetical protein